VVWVPGNHELWTAHWAGERARGQDKYNQLIDLCRSYRVLTPEDPYPIVSIGDAKVRVVPLFLLYDYSFRPPHIPLERAVGWAKESGVCCMDEFALHSDPYRDVSEWCGVRCELSERKLRLCCDGTPNVLINHFPLRGDLVRLPKIPRFSIWCGTVKTEDWHIRFNAAVVISGHLHIRSTQYRDGVRFEEVSLGYPWQWGESIESRRRVKQVLPAAATSV
jgi:hypothetical protein